MDGFQQLESIAAEIIEIFDIVAPPVPIESMLQHPKNKMWEVLDITQLSGGFLSIKERYSPRMSLARLLARHVAGSDWGREKGLFTLVQQGDNLQAFARMLIMPAEMVQNLNPSQLNPSTMSLHFEVPEDDARIRLQEVL